MSVIPGIRANHTSGRAHQISCATASTASAPPYWLPSESRKRSSRNNSDFGKPSSAPTRGSCSGATASPRRSRIGRSQRAIRVQKAHSASKNNQPRACRPFPSVNSDAGEIMRSTCLLFLRTQQSNHLPAQLYHALQRAGRHAQNLLKQARHRRQKFQHAFQPLAGVRVALRAGLQLLHALGEHAQRGINLAALSLFGNNAENFPNVLDELEMPPPPPHHAHPPPHPPPFPSPQ